MARHRQRQGKMGYNGIVDVCRRVRLADVSISHAKSFMETDPSSVVTVRQSKTPQADGGNGGAVSCVYGSLKPICLGWTDQGASRHVLGRSYISDALWC